MAEAHASSVPAHAGTILGVIRSHTAAHRRLAQAEPWLRLAVPVMLALFLATVLLSVAIRANGQRNDILTHARDDIETLARLATAALAPSTGVGEGAPGSLARSVERLGRLLPRQGLTRGRQVLLIDAAGTVLAALPAVPPPLRTLTEHLGDGQPLGVLGERAGVLEVRLGTGLDALATVHTLPGGIGQVAVTQSVHAATEGWRSDVRAQGTLLCAAALVIVCMGVAYSLQADRAGSVDRVCERVKHRVDAALGSGRCGLWDWDIARGRIYWSNSMYALLGYRREHEFLSFGDVNALVHPEDGDLYGLARQLASVRQSAVDHEFRIRSADGRWVWLKARAEMVSDAEDGSGHLVGICVDITEQRRLAESTQAADARLRDAVEAISEAFVLWDAQNRLVLCNSKFQRLHDLSPEDATTGRRYADVMGQGRAPMIRRELAQAPLEGETGTPAREAELSDGRWLQISERRTKDGGYVSVGTDITTLKVQQERLVESERQLLATVRDLKRSRQTLELQAQQLADMAERYLDQKAQAETANRSKSDFLAKMSHELRTPLNAILGFAEVMQEGVLGPLGHDKYREYCRDIRQSGDYLLSLIDDVLDMSRLDARRVELATQIIPVREAVERAVRLVAEAARAKALTLEVAVREGAALVADPRALHQILTNLVQNAVKFTPEGGAVRVVVRPSGGMVGIFVEDSGIGIPRAALARLGQPFAQVETEYSRNYKGSGLGLAIARGLAELHGGSLRIRSQEGVGTVVMVRLEAAAVH